MVQLILLSVRQMIIKSFIIICLLQEFTGHTALPKHNGLSHAPAQRSKMIDELNTFRSRYVVVINLIDTYADLSFLKKNNLNI